MVKIRAPGHLCSDIITKKQVYFSAPLLSYIIHIIFEK